MNLKKIISGVVAASLCLMLSGCHWGKDDNNNTPKVASGYEVTLYQDGTAQPTISADTFTYDADNVSYQVKGKDRTSPAQTGSGKGTWVVKHRSWKPVAQDKRYQVTLYSGSKAVGSWTVAGFSTDTRSVLLFPSDGSEVLRICGNVVVKSLKPVKIAPATSKVTVYNGEASVYEVEFSSSVPVGKHVEGAAADGSGNVWIWGNYKEVNYIK